MHTRFMVKRQVPLLAPTMEPAEELPEEPPPKKAKFADNKFALVSCFDEPDKLVEMDLSLLDSIGCRLGSVIRHTQPCELPSGKQFWRSGMTRAMLLTFIRSLTVGELVLSKGVTVGEALSVFEFEGVAVGRVGGGPSIEPPRFGVAHTKRAEPVSETLTRLCENVADAIVSWPRLEMVLDNAMGVHAVDAYCRGYSGNITATSNRLWVRFADRPKSVDADGTNFVVALVLKNPRWFAETMTAVGMVHYRMSLNDPEFAKARDETAFKKLCSEIDNDSMSCFFPVKTDAPKTHCEPKLRKMISRGERFANEIRNTIIQFAHDGDADSKATLSVQYARAIVTYTENLMTSAPVCAKVFSSLCADENGGTPERTALKRALKTRGVSVVRWVEERDASVRPLVFPSNWRDGPTSCYGPSALLSFEGIR